MSFDNVHKLLPRDFRTEPEETTMLLSSPKEVAIPSSRLAFKSC